MIPARLFPRPPMQTLKYLSGYPDHLQQRARALLDAGKLGETVRSRYPQAHAVRNDRQLHDYVQELKARHLRQSSPLGKVLYDGKLQVLKHALGLHTAISRNHGGKLKASREIPSPACSAMPRHRSCG